MARRAGWIFALIAAIGLGSWAVIELRRPPQWNLLLVTLDTTRADRIGCYGYDGALTPAMDGLAARGVLVERAYASVPLTLPSHATIFTGLYPPEHGLHTNGLNSLADEIPTLAGVMGKNGYATGGFIAAFVLASKFGLNRGFQNYDERLGTDDDHGDGLHRNRPGNQVVDVALEWLGKHDRRPFFCWVHLYDPHHPYEPHADVFGDQFTDRPYDAEIAYVDQQLKRLLDHLEQRGLTDRTLVVVVGDHGEGLGDHGERTHGHMLYNSCLHVPLIIAPPGPGQKARRISESVSLVDVYPTLLDCFNISPPGHVSGRSLKPAFEGQPLATVPCYSETNEPFHAARCSPLQCVITDEWKYVRTPRAELFNLKRDPQELENLLANRPEQVERMKVLLADLESRMARSESPETRLSSAEERALAGLGYLGGKADPEAVAAQGNLADTKDMLPYFNACDDALREMTYRNYAAAEKILRSVVDAAPLFFESRCSLGVCLHKQRKFAEAEAEFQRALELGAAPSTVNIQLGLARLNLGKYSESFENFSAAAELNPDSAEVQLYRGMALHKLSRYAEAVEAFRLAVDLDPELAAARTALDAAERALASQKSAE